MRTYFRSFRVVPRWVSVIGVLTVVYMTVVVGIEGWYEYLAWAPAIGVFGYGVLAGLCDRIKVKISTGGVELEIGPLPMTLKPERVRASEVVKVYVRRATVPIRVGSAWYHAAGIQRSDGRWLDLSQPFLGEEAVRREAGEIASALGWQGPIEELRGVPPKLDWRAAMPGFYWAGALFAGALWGFYAELYLLHA